MAKNSTKSASEDTEDTMADNTENSAPQRTATIDVSPDKGGNLLAAWRGVFHLFGGRAKFGLVDGGIGVTGFSVLEPYDPATIVKDVSGRERRVDLIDSLPILQGNDPKAFTEALEMTKWMQQYFRTPGEDGKSPSYVKDAIAEYKKVNGFPGRRGRPKKVIRIENLGKLDAALLSQVDPKELKALQATIDQALANAANANAESGSANAETSEVTA